jgi:N utilization substance protein B
VKPSQRHKARRLAVQAIYSWQLTQNDVADVELEYVTNQVTKGVALDYFRTLLVGVAHKASKLDEELAPYLDRKTHQLDPIEKAILRLAMYELKFCQDVPFKVVINEAIELAKVFGAVDGHKYINGVLDKFMTHHPELKRG